MNSFIF